MLLSETLKRLWLFICALAGILATLSAILFVFLLLLAMIIAVSNGEFVDKWPVFQWMVVLWLSLVAFLNMLYFFQRLKRTNPELYFTATGGLSASTFIMSSRSAYRSLHGWVVRAAKDPRTPFASSLRSHAIVTRYINLVCLYGWFSLILAMVGIVIYADFIRAT